jgi:hypothetical protein
MKVLTAPLTFVDGDILPPEDLNALYLYARDAVADVASKRWAKAVLPIQCTQVVGTNITEASAALLTHRFKCPVTCIVERAFLSANMTSSGEVTVVIIATGGSTPTGATVPLLSTAAAVTVMATDTNAINTDRFVLTAGTEYSLTITPAAGVTFILERFDITLHVAVDRWTLAGTTSVPDFDPTLVTDASARNATVVAANNTALTTEANKFAAALGACMPMVFHVHGFLDVTDADLRTITIPRISSARGLCIVKRIYVFADMAGAGGAADTITADLQNASSVSQATAVADVNGVSYAAGDSGALSVALHGSVSAATTTDDFKLILTNNDAANVCNRATVLIWVARG